jgi:hypothetical protein
MILTDHDLKQIDRDYVEGIAHNKLVEVSLKLLADLKEARDRLNQTSQNLIKPRKTVPAHQEVLRPGRGVLHRMAVL